MPYELSEIIESLNAHGLFAVACLFATVPVSWSIWTISFTGLLDGDGQLRYSHHPAVSCMSRYSIWGLYLFCVGLGLVSHSIADKLRLGF